jgi:hypothetical protein
MMPIHRKRRRLVRDGDSYTLDEEDRGDVELEEVPRRDEPPIEIQGEPWGGSKWNRDFHPLGWREDGDYDPGARERGDPGPFDGEWERP